MKEICFSEKEDPIAFLNKQVGENMSLLFMRHYRKFNLEEWKEMLEEKIQYSTHLGLIIEDGIKAVALYDASTTPIFIEIFCSRCNRGGELLKELIAKYKRIELNADPTAVGFYKKYGFHIAGPGFVANGIRYPLMRNYWDMFGWFYNLIIRYFTN